MDGTQNVLVELSRMETCESVDTHNLDTGIAWFPGDEP